MRIGLAIAAALSALTLAACGGSDSGNSSAASASIPTVTAPVGATGSGTTATTAKNSKTQTQATTTTPSKQGRVVTLPNGEPAIVAPGTRKACFKKWAPQFPPGQARQAILSQCRNIPPG